MCAVAAAGTDLKTGAGQQPFRCTVPHRGRSAFNALAGFIFAAAFLPGLLLVPAGWMVYVSYAAFLIAAAFAVLFVFAAAMPRWFLMGVALHENGFEYRRPLRRPKTIPYSSIHRIDAVKAGDGEAGDEVRLLVYAHRGKVALACDLLYGSGLLQVFESRLSLDQVALGNALRHEPRGLEFFVPKRFTIFEKAKR
jgi:hypothetical protein